MSASPPSAIRPCLCLILLRSVMLRDRGHGSSHHHSPRRPGRSRRAGGRRRARRQGLRRDRRPGARGGYGAPRRGLPRDRRCLAGRLHRGQPDEQVMRIAREALRMINAGSGSIVLVGSQLAHVASPATRAMRQPRAASRPSPAPSP